MSSNTAIWIYNVLLSILPFQGALFYGVAISRGIVPDGIFINLVYYIQHPRQVGISAPTSI